MTSTDHKSSTVSDQEFLDRVFERAVEHMEEGLNADVNELLEGREHLRASVVDLLKLARNVATGAPRPALPLVHGFTLVSELGRGGMGAVYLARQDRLGGRLVALKVLPSAAMLSPKARQRFRTEAHAIAKLRHDHIVAVHDVVQDEDSHAFAMEWVEGTSLVRVIEELSQHQTVTTSTTQQGDARMSLLKSLLGSPAGCFSGMTWPVYVVRMGVAMARALEAVHNAGMLHRDIKPSNILIRRDGTPLLSDFGLARETDATVTSVGAFAGTAAYAAPEQLRGDAELDCRADTYSLGVTIYHALALRMPYKGLSATQILRQIEAGAAPPLRKINRKLPVDLQTVVAKAMDADPARRYQTAGEFADDLQRLLNLQPVKARPAGVATRIVKMARRNRAALGAALIGGVLAIGAVTLGLTYFIGFPKWSQAHLNEARLVLLDPEQSDAMFSVLFFSEANAAGLPVASQALDDAISHYDAAVRFAPFDRELAAERNLVRVAREIIVRPDPGPVTIEGDATLTLTEAFASRVCAAWSKYGNDRNTLPIDAQQLQAASGADLRSLGLLAMLCGDSGLTMKAWTAFDLKAGSDPLVEACFGVAYLISKQYARAYPRLRSAVEAFPNVGFLTVYLAEAAAKSGDYDKALRWLDEARSMPRLDRFNGLKRVQAGLYAAIGEEERARKTYEELLAENKNIVAFDEYVRFLEARGDFERAMHVYLLLVGFGQRDADLYRRFVGATEHWWAGLEEAERHQLVQANLAWTDYRKDRNGVLPTYAKCFEWLGQPPPPGGIPRSRQVRE